MKLMPPVNCSAIRRSFSQTLKGLSYMLWADGYANTISQASYEDIRDLLRTDWPDVNQMIDWNHHLVTNVHSTALFLIGRWNPGG